MKKDLEEKRWSVGMLFIGVVLGVSGSLVGNVLDRQFVRFGIWYDLFVAIFFFVMVWYTNRIFIKILGEK